MNVNVNVVFNEARGNTTHVHKLKVGIWLVFIGSSISQYK
jgi:hypothetical protein